ncbi:MAG: DUF1571 domain-containing protein [Planctomycetes bacterium]|nr:DUF1571 domain-containing protein [Planctomycetota bacterium]
MRFLLRRVKSLNPQQKANSAAVAIALGTIAFLNLECQPRPAGADTVRLAVTKTTLNLTAQKVIVQADAAAKQLTPEQIHDRNLAQKVELLKKGIALLKSTPDYTAQFMKRELVGGEMLEEQNMSIKVRHAPFSVYLKWHDYDIGREVMYVDGVNDGQMLVKAGGWKSKLPAISMAPDSSLAMKEARYPVTKAGLLELAESIVNYNSEDLKLRNFSGCHLMEDQLVGERTCACFVLEYKDRDSSREYRKSITLIDKEWGVPLLIKNYGWPNEDVAQNDETIDEETLIEHYTYSDVKFRSSLTAADFDHQNEDYGFRR